MIRRYSREPMRQIWTEENKFALWLQIEILACEARKIPAKDLATIKRRAKFDVERIHEIERTTNHDVIAFLTNVAENVGPASRHIHEGLTSSDVVDTALAVQMVQSADILIDDVKALRAVVAKKAKKYKLVPMIGRTHGVHAEPITFGLKMALMYDEFGRALARLERARDIIAVGKVSGAVGTYAHMDPRVEQYVCKKLGLQPDRISTQIVQRDRHAEFMSAMALVGCSIDRWALEFRHLQRTEVLEAEEFFAEGQKGSSAMPHKRNPVLSENLTGLSRMVRAYVTPAMENVVLWHERDISHSSAERMIAPDATVTLDFALNRLASLIDKLLIYPENMQKNLDRLGGLVHSQRLLIALTQKGASREDAYKLVQRNAMPVWRGEGDFQTLLKKDPDVKKYLSDAEIEEQFDLGYHFKHVDTIFKRVFGDS